MPRPLYSFSSGEEPAPTFSPGAIFAIGDVHGHAAHLDALLQLVRPLIAGHRERGREVALVTLGDYVDRGPANLQVLTRLAGLAREAGVAFHALEGNHDRYLIDFLSQPVVERAELEQWVAYGGTRTLHELGVSERDLAKVDIAILQARARTTMGSDRMAFLGRLALHARLGDWLLVHAGVDPVTDLADQRADIFRLIREPFLTGAKWAHRFSVVHGHTIRGNEVWPHRVGIDCGCYRTGVLSAVEIAGERLRFHCITDRPDLAEFKKLTGSKSGLTYSKPERLG